MKVKEKSSKSKCAAHYTELKI